jgi:hypothetical protein
MSPSRPLLVDQLKIKQEPRGLLARYFLAVEAEAEANGVSFSIVSPEEFLRVHTLHEQSWNGLAPIFDCRCSDIPANSVACIVGYNRENEPVVAAANRVYDLGDSTVKTAFEDLTFWYGSRAASYRKSVECKVTAPTASVLSGRVMYNGAFWLRPDLRKTGVGRVTQEIGRFYSYTQWAFDHEISVGSPAFNRPDIQQRYGFDGHENSFEIIKDNKPLLRGLFLWAHHATHINRIRKLIEQSQSEVALQEHVGAKQIVSSRAIS